MTFRSLGLSVGVVAAAAGAPAQAATESAQALLQNGVFADFNSVRATLSSRADVECLCTVQVSSAVAWCAQVQKRVNALKWSDAPGAAASPATERKVRRPSDCQPFPEERRLVFRGRPRLLPRTTVTTMRRVLLRGRAATAAMTRGTARGTATSTAQTTTKRTRRRPARRRDRGCAWASRCWGCRRCW